MSRACAGLSIIVLAAWPGWTAESAEPKSQQPSVSSRERTPIAAEDLEAPQDAADLDLVPAISSVPRKRTFHSPVTATEGAATEFAPASPTASRHRKVGRSSVRQTSFQPDFSPVPDSGPGLAVRPFRKIADIVPYDDYEPDPEIAAKDRCNNLCPRPQGGDCPDCSKDGDGNMIPCPECPWEQELRRIGRAPGEPDRPFIPRDFAHIHYCWEPTNLYHNPIYFEDVSLERYGHTRHYLIQPIFSIAKFAVQLGGLPYQMSIYPVWDRQYSLGYYRPGEFVPYKYHQLPLNAKAALVEAGVISGAYFLFAPGVGP